MPNFYKKFINFTTKMESAKITTFNCPVHQKLAINMICSNFHCYTPLSCIGCVLEDDCPHLTHKKQLMCIDDYIDYIGIEYTKIERLKLGQEGPPKEFTDYILGEDESLTNLSKHIEEEKKLLEQTLNNLMDEFKEICSMIKVVAIDMLDQQFDNFRTNHQTYKAKLKKFYKDNNASNPTKFDLMKEFNEAKSLDEFMKIIDEIQSDFIDRAPTDPNFLKKTIEEVKYRLSQLGQAIKAQHEIRPKLQINQKEVGSGETLEDFSKKAIQILDGALKLTNPIPEIIDIYHLNTKIMNLSEDILLESWVNPKKQFTLKLIYRATRDGFTADAFHQKVGDLKPTVVIIKSEFDKKFGGYSDIDWSVNNGYKQSSNAFLFSLDEKEIYPIKQGKQLNAIACGQSYGPTFGGGNDIYICDQSNIINKSYSNFNNSYDSKGKNNIHLTGGYNFKTKEIEIFQLV